MSDQPTAARRAEWRECVETHAQEDWGTTCDACLYLPEVYARMEALEAAASIDVERLAEAMENTAPIKWPARWEPAEFRVLAHEVIAALARLAEGTDR